MTSASASVQQILVPSGEYATQPTPDPGAHFFRSSFSGSICCSMLARSPTVCGRTGGARPARLSMVTTSSEACSWMSCSSLVRALGRCTAPANRQSAGSLAANVHRALYSLYSSLPRWSYSSCSMCMDRVSSPNVRSHSASTGARHSASSSSTKSSRRAWRPAKYRSPVKNWNPISLSCTSSWRAIASPSTRSSTCDFIMAAAQNIVRDLVRDSDSAIIRAVHSRDSCSFRSIRPVSCITCQASRSFSCRSFEM
mmetsp:Transcript_201/g.535  ORF Transcript_201/g.535 Transcript_201/m.535 type:complete len:254 (+) Transcript_201:773-1534(+)